MNENNRTESANSQELRASGERLARRAPLALFWLILTALLWGGPIIITIYLPLLLIENGLNALPGLSFIARVTKRLKDEVFVWGIFCYLRMQPWFRVELDFREIHRLAASKTKFMIVSNHRSHLDVFFMIAHVRSVRVLAKDSLFRVPLLGFVMRLSKQIPARKGSLSSLRDAMESVKRRLGDRDPVLIFPEFTRCEAGMAGTNQFSLLPFQIARDTDAEIVPFVIHNTDEIWPRRSNVLRTGPRIRMKATPSVKASSFKSVESLRDFVKLRINEELTHET